MLVLAVCPRLSTNKIRYNMNTRISIIVATYNAENTIKRCIDSIACQKTNEIELLVIDGGSNDRTMDILKSYGNLIDILKSEKDKGVYDAWNKALRIATGEWIMFLGADDYFLPDAMSLYLDFLQGKEDVDSIDIICARCRLIDETGKYLRTFGTPYKREIFVDKMEISHGSTLHNRKLFQEVGEFNLNFKICADYEFLLRKKMSSFFIDREIFVMQVGGMSSSVKGVFDSYRVKQHHRITSQYRNLYYLIKGTCGYYCKKVWYLVKK